VTYPGAPQPVAPTPDTASALPADGVGVYGVSIADIGALVKSTVIVPETSALRQDKSATYEQVIAWIEQLSAGTFTAIPNIGRVPAGDALDTLNAGVKYAVACGVASTLVAALFPEIAKPSDQQSYAAILWKRYTDGVANANTAIATIIRGGPGNGGAAAWCFPPPMSRDRRAF